MPNNYNRIAKVYDSISKLVYQRSIIQAQVFLLQQVSSNNNILIVGGGTGWILEELAKLRLQNICVVYVEKSAEMISISKKRNYANVHVDFVECGIEEFETDKKFDVILTAFLFDNFKTEKIEIIFSQLNRLLKQNGLWLYADFINDGINSKWWQQLLLKTMYLFFKLTANIETQTLIDMKPYFTQYHYSLIAQQFFYRRFIQAIAYKK